MTIDLDRSITWIVLTGAMLIGAGAAGCAGHAIRSAYEPLTESDRQTARAEKLTHEAASLILSDPVRAERLLREALAADLYHGPAHNNLGVVYLEQGKLYQAAGEFEWARKLMPGNADARMNLALVFERAGRIDEAISRYRDALEVQPEHLPTIQALTRAQVRYGKRDPHTRSQLETIALRAEPPWGAWARSLLSQTTAGPP